MKTRIIELIITDKNIWSWTEWDPLRRLVQLWTKDGKLVAEQDMSEYKGSFAHLDLIK